MKYLIFIFFRGKLNFPRIKLIPITNMIIYSSAQASHLETTTGTTVATPTATTMKRTIMGRITGKGRTAVVKARTMMTLTGPLRMSQRLAMILQSSWRMKKKTEQMVAAPEES